MSPVAINRRSEFRMSEVSLGCNRFQRRPELVFDADARLVAVNDDGAFDDRRLHDAGSFPFTGRGLGCQSHPCREAAITAKMNRAAKVEIPTPMAHPVARLTTLIRHPTQPEVSCNLIVAR